MAVRTPTASESAQIGPPGPIRSCIGCRQRAAAAELLRVVVAAGTVVPDPRSRAAGRGAWLHPVLACVELAERRRAFGRALHVPEPVDPTPVGEYVAKLVGSPPAEPRRR
ncbi:MAG TPA: YlxR family protein [Jatrophihabitantaceae bacterium]